MKKTQIHFFLSLMFAFSLVLSACGTTNNIPTATQNSTVTIVQATEQPTAEVTGPISLTDGLGRQVTLDAPAQRVISLAPSNTELLYSVGAGNQVIGRDEFSNYPAEVASLTNVGGSFGDFDLETIASLEPDLVLMAEINTATQVKSLEDLGLTVYYLSNPDDLNGLYQNIQIVGTLTGHSEDANTLVESLQTRVQAVEDKLVNNTTLPKVFYELDATDPTKPWTAGDGSYINTLITLAGGQNIGAGLSSSYAEISSEEIITQNPDIILLGDAAYGISVESVSQRSGWSAINAVKNNQIFSFDDDTVSRPTARMVDALENLAKILHPDLFG
jgi:iron complex transport system substrate-binding protein